MTFTNIEGNPNHTFFTASGYHTWLCLFIFLALCIFYFMRKFISILEYIFPSCCKQESTNIDTVNDEGLPDFWDALKGD